MPITLNIAKLCQKIDILCWLNESSQHVIVKIDLAKTLNSWLIWESIIAVKFRLRRSRLVNPGYNMLIQKMKLFPMRNEKLHDILDPRCLIPRLYLLFLDQGTRKDALHPGYRTI